MADKFYMLLLSSGEDFFGEEKSDLCIELLMERDWLQVIELITFLLYYSQLLYSLGTIDLQGSAGNIQRNLRDPSHS